MRNRVDFLKKDFERTSRHRCFSFVCDNIFKEDLEKCVNKSALHLFMCTHDDDATTTRTGSMQYISCKKKTCWIKQKESLATDSSSSC